MIKRFFKLLHRKTMLIFDMPHKPISDKQMKLREKNTVDCIISKYSCGNWALQNSYYTTSEDIEKLAEYNRKHSFL